MEFDRHQRVIISLKQYLEKIRQKVSAEIDQFPPFVNKLQCERDRLRCTENLRTITCFMSAVQSVSYTTTSLMTMFTSLVVSKAVSVCGKAPCSFCVVGMGSLAKGEMTPYSDLEFLFLIERKTPESLKYFEKLAVTVYFIIGNLKETKLKYMNIAELKGWFDDKSTNGFKIDGLSVNAGNIPTGNGSTQPRYRMIKTVDKAALWYERVFTTPDEKDSVRADESAMLSNTCQIHGERRLHDEFTSGISSLFQNSARRAAIKAMIANDIEKFEFLPGEKLVEIRNVKKDLFRFPSLIVFDLRQFHQIWVKDLWAVIEELRRLSIISAEVWLSLKFLYAVGSYCRLAAYQRCGSQAEDFSVLHTSTACELPKAVLIHLFVHLIPIRQALAQYITLGNSRALQTKLTSDDSLALSLTHYYYGNYRQFTELIEERCEGETARLGTKLRLMYAYGLIQCQRFDAAEKMLNNTLEGESVGLGDLVRCYYLLGLSYHEESQYRKSSHALRTADRHMKSELLNVFHPNAAAIYGLMGANFLELGDNDSALHHHEKSLNMQLSIYGHTDHPDIATSYNNMASVYYSQGDYGKALQYHEKSLNMQLRIYGHIDHPVIASSYSNMANIYDSQGDYSKALHYHEKGLNMKLNIHGQADHPAIASSYNKIASVYYSQGNCSKALQYHEKSLNMRINIYGHTDHPDIASSHHNMASAYYLQENYSKTLKHYEKSLNMQLSIYGHTDHPDIATSYNNIASVYNSQGEYSKSLKHYEKSLNMLLIIYGHTDHPDIAFSYNNMASVYRSQGNYSKALQYHEKSLKMRLAVHQTAPHSDIFNSYLSLGDVSMSLFNFSSAVRYYQQSLCTLQLLSCDEKQLDSLRSMTD